MSNSSVDVTRVHDYILTGQKLESITSTDRAGKKKYNLTLFLLHAAALTPQRRLEYSGMFLPCFSPDALGTAGTWTAVWLILVLSECTVKVCFVSVSHT